MYFQERKDRRGHIYYSVLYRTDTGKLVRLPKSLTAHITSPEEAEKFVQAESTKRETAKDHNTRVLAWKTKHHDFEALSAKYAKWQERAAPNTWKSCVSYLEQWIYRYFRDEIQEGNANNWHLHFRSFLDWLQGPLANKRWNKGQPLAVSTVNNIVKSLNTFLQCLKEYGDINPASAMKCPTLPEHLVGQRGVDDLILEPEREAVLAVLRTIYEPAADFFLVLWHTGMRFSELFGLPITALFRDRINDASMTAELNLHKIDYVGYLYLDSQPARDDRKREPDKSIARKPLKSCKTIGPKHARVIPIRDKTVWNILAKRYLAQQAAFTEHKYTSVRQDYVFFDDAEWNRTVNALRKAYAHLGLEPKQYHCCRHTFVTLLVGETRSNFLARMITGHKSAKSFERYLHLYEKIANAARQQAQVIDLIS